MNDLTQHHGGTGTAHLTGTGTAPTDPAAATTGTAVQPTTAAATGTGSAHEEDTMATTDPTTATGTDLVPATAQAPVMLVLADEGYALGRHLDGSPAMATMAHRWGADAGHELRPWQSTSGGKSVATAAVLQCAAAGRDMQVVLAEAKRPHAHRLYRTSRRWPAALTWAALAVLLLAAPALAASAALDLTSGYVLAVGAAAVIVLALIVRVCVPADSHERPHKRS